MASPQAPLRDPLIDMMGGSEDRATLRRMMVAHLGERSVLYHRLSRSEADQLRGYLLSRLADIGVPEDALPFLREELELGDSACCAGGAARAVASLDPMPDWAAEALLCAARRFMNGDDTLVFSPDVSLRGAQTTTALTEIFAAMGRLGPRAGGTLAALDAMADMRPFGPCAAAALDLARDRIRLETPKCCGGKTDIPPDRSLTRLKDMARSDNAARLGDILLEDHQGHEARLGDVFDADINVVAFFYTRCMNPAKCSATIETLAQLQNSLGPLADRCRVGAISYEPAYDTPRRLSIYGGNRGIGPDSPVRLTRPVNGIEPLIAQLDLGVGYGETTINRHRSEVFLLDRQANVVAGILRRKFTVEEAISLIER